MLDKIVNYTRLCLLSYFVKKDYAFAVRLLIFKIDPTDATRLTALAVKKDSLNSLKVLAKIEATPPSYTFTLDEAINNGNFKVYNFLSNRSSDIYIHPSGNRVVLKSSDEVIHNILKSS